MRTFTNTKIFYLLLFSLIILTFSTYNHTNATPPTEVYVYIDFDDITGLVFLDAEIFPPNSPYSIEEIYYYLDGGEKNLYTEPFIFPEGTHFLEYGAKANGFPLDAYGSITLTFDSTPPTVKITEPNNGIYIFGDRFISIKNICICFGKVPISVSAEDGDGYGVDKIFFDINNDSGYDEFPPYEYTYKEKNFGYLTISITAVDYKGLMSETQEKTILVFNI